MKRSREEPLHVGDVVVWDFGNDTWVGSVLEARASPGRPTKYLVVWSHSPDGGWWTDAHDVEATMRRSGSPKMAVVQAAPDKR